MAIFVIGVVVLVVALAGRRMSSRDDRAKRAVLQRLVGEEATVVVEELAAGVRTWALQERAGVIAAVERGGVRIDPRPSGDYVPLSRIREIRGAHGITLSKW